MRMMKTLVEKFLLFNTKKKGEKEASKKRKREKVVWKRFHFGGSASVGV